MTPSPNEFEGRYGTQAVESRVLDRDRETVGHVGLLDLDGVPEGQAVEAAESLPGVVAVLRTSTGSYHLWSLAVDRLDGWIERAAHLPVVDRDHVALSESRECAVVRVDPKVGLSDGREVKPAPVPVEIVDGPTPLPLSEPHAKVLREDLGADIPMKAGREWVGYSVERRTYMADIGGRGGR